ncbi:unnamed protein product [Nyctereutes procyonoides]|uniref:(raccoon dog) hypothetical protein n=1 Tax=Nyctereutes procyonoides TaxID=34880 RepID=A0A811ZRB2_NYCPR|nr:unnamed protein product [Nyctereutes procyonoides]
MSAETPITLNIDPQDLQVQTFTVEKLLEPLIIQDLKSPNQRDEIAGARASLKQNSPLLHSICSACLEHSDVASLKASKDTVCEEIHNALNVISNASQGIQNMIAPPESKAATLGSALDELENLIVLDPLTVTEEEIRPSLEKRLEAIISGAALLADSSCTRDFHRERIIAECNAIRQALQDLLSEYMNNVGNWLSTNPIHGYVLKFFLCTNVINYK